MPNYLPQRPISIPRRGQIVGAPPGSFPVGSSSGGGVKIYTPHPDQPPLMPVTRGPGSQ
jgi:hypothetical protein